MNKKEQLKKQRQIERQKQKEKKRKRQLRIKQVVIGFLAFMIVASGLAGVAGQMTAPQNNAPLIGNSTSSSIGTSSELQLNGEEGSNIGSGVSAGASATVEDEKGEVTK